MRFLRALVAFACSLTILAGAASAQTAPPDRLKKVLASGVLRVGTTFDTPLFSMRDAAGNPSGFDMDLMTSLGAAMGVKIVYVKMSFVTMMSDLADDKFDVAIAGMGRTYDRARVATFSKPYLVYGKLMMIRTADAAKYHTLSDLDKPGLKMAYNKGGLNDKFVHTMFKVAEPAGYDTNELATADLLAGKVDAQSSDSWPALYMAKNNPKITVMSPDHVFNPVYVAMLLHPDDQSLLNFINIWIDQITLDGTLAGVKKKWTGT